MTTYLKKALHQTADDTSETRAIVEGILADIRAGREDKVRELSQRFDNWDGDIVVTRDKIDAAIQMVPAGSLQARLVSTALRRSPLSRRWMTRPASDRPATLTPILG